MNGHEIVWEYDYDQVSSHAVCHEPAGADCRLIGVDGCECESLSVERDPDGTPFHMVTGYDGDERHEMRAVDYCNVVEFMDQSDCLDESGTGHFEIGRTRIEPIWNGDDYEWEPVR